MRAAEPKAGVMRISWRTTVGSNGSRVLAPALESLATCRATLGNRDAWLRSASRLFCCGTAAFMTSSPNQFAPSESNAQLDEKLLRSDNSWSLIEQIATCNRSD